MKSKVPQILPLGGMEFIFVKEHYENEYNFRRHYEFHHLLSNEEMFAVINDVASNHGSLNYMHVFYNTEDDDGGTVQLNKYYESLEAFHDDVVPNTYRCVRLWINTTLGDKPIEYSLFNHEHEKGEKQYAYLLVGCHDKTCGGTVNTIVYYMHDGQPVKHDTNGDAFYFWDEEKREWVRSHSLWCDFFGWDGWGDGIGVFEKIDSETIQKLLWHEALG